MEFLKLNQKVQVVLEENEIITKSCLSQIMDYDSSSMLIAEPQYRSQPVDIPVGAVIEVLVIDSKCVYSFNTSVIGKQKAPPSLWLSLPETYRRVQRREYVRVNMKLPAVINLKAETEIESDCLTANILAEKVYQDGYYSTTSIDVSGGGIKIFGPVQFQPDTIISIILRLPMKEIITNAKVVRSELNTKISEKEFSPDEFARFNYITALCFHEIEDTDRSTVIQLCFKRQLELRQRGIV
ncbi:MAG: flagellar brake domain-containing protein [Cyanobacteriota bacterium]